MIIFSGSLKEVILLLTNKDSARINDMYHALRKATKNHADIFVLFHQGDRELPSVIRQINSFAFTNEILSSLGYTPIENSLLPGSNHFPLLQFYLKRPDYSYYWVIEDDVRFNGDWTNFFDNFLLFKQDFISCHFHSFKEDPNWHWWATLHHPLVTIPFSQRIRSFNPIYRISNAALQFIHTALSSQWKGHHEVLIPTLLKHGGYDLLDFGGNNDYVLQGFKDKFYTNSSMRFRPVHSDMGNKQNILYHPVKIF